MTGRALDLSPLALRRRSLGLLLVVLGRCGGEAARNRFVDSGLAGWTEGLTAARLARHSVWHIEDIGCRLLGEPQPDHSSLVLQRCSDPARFAVSRCGPDQCRPRRVRTSSYACHALEAVTRALDRTIPRACCCSTPSFASSRDGERRRGRHIRDDLRKRALWPPRTGSVKRLVERGRRCTSGVTFRLLCHEHKHVKVGSFRFDGSSRSCPVQHL